MTIRCSRRHPYSFAKKLYGCSFCRCANAHSCSKLAGLSGPGGFSAVPLERLEVHLARKGSTQKADIEDMVCELQLNTDVMAYVK